MFGKVHPVRYAGKFEFGLKDVGKFPPKPRSIFHDKEKLAQGQDGENDKNDDKQENDEEGGNDDDSSAFSPSIAAITEVRSPKMQYKNGSPPKTETKRVGRIQFEGIVIPPSAPKDLICEECEKKTASLFCSACEEVFCVDCADIAHPRVSQNDLMHQHEKDGKIRALRVGDKSRVKNDTTTFFLPDEELQIEDYMKLKDLTKPNSLSTGSDAKKFKPSLQKRSTPQFKVNQMVLFKDPVSGRDAYGQVMSEWDQRHGTGVTPAILRGEDSLVYYIVQQHGLLVDVEHLVDLVPGLEEKMGGGSKPATATDSHNPRHSSTHTADADQETETETETVISDATHSTLLVKGTDKNIPLRKEYEIALSVNKRLKDLKNILTLGPKHHLRDLRDPKNIMAKQLHPEAFGDDTYSHGTIDQSMAMSTLPGPGPGLGPGTTSISAMPSLGHPASGLLQLHPTSPNSITKRNGLGHASGESIAAASRFQEITSPGKVSIAGDRSVLTYKPRLPVLQQYYADSLQQEAAEKRTNEEAAAAGSSEAPYTNVDLNLYANIDGDAQTLLSYYNPHYKPLPAPQRSYEDLLRSQLLFPIDKSAQKDLLAAEEADHHHHHHAVFYHTDRYSDGRREAPAWTSFLVVGEQDLQSLHAYIEDIERRKRQLLTRIFHRQDYLFMKIQLHRKFRYWKNNLKAIWVQRQHICATKIQTRARVWLCRYKLSDLREYWAQVYEERRLAVHAQFRFSRRGDPYAVTYDNKKFFATHADMNRYCRFLALMLSRIVRFMNRKRLRLMGKTIVVWKSAIYDFVESTLQNEHIDLALVDFDRRQHGVFSLEQEKEKMIETFQMLMQSLPHGDSAQQQQQQQLLWYDNRQHNTVSSWPLRIEPPLSFFDTHRAAQAAAAAAVKKAALQQRYEDTVPPYDPATMMPFLPELPRVQRPQTFKERLQQDVAAAAKTAAAFDPHEALVEGRIPMAGAVSYAYWMLPNVVMVGDAPFGPAHTNSWKLVPTYEFYAEKRIYHHEPFPMELQYPYESGCNGFLRDEDIDLVGGVTMIRRNKLRAMQRQQEALTQKSSTNALAKPPRQKEILSAITQLLMSGVDTFISLLSEEEETRVEGYYKALPLPALIDEAMEKAQLTANRIIVDNQDIIHKQEAHLEKIPHYGKTDPRYPQAFREKLRCQARIALAESNIVRIRKQVKNIPTNGIKFHRLPVMQHAYPWTVDHVLPSLWQLEKIIAETMARYDPASQSHGKIYFYGGGLACDEDGPARDGRAGLFMSMVLGRLYHIEPQEALYRWQKAHDCMPALKHMKLTATSSSTTYLTNCPPLPWQKNLLFDVLRRSHLPLDYPTIRIQLEPDRFQDLHRNHYDESLRYQVGVIEAALDAQEGNNKGKRPASPPPFKVPGIKVRSNAGVVKPTDVTQEKDEADKGYSVAYEEAERQEAILRSGTERMKQSAYFHQELVWPPVDPNVHQAGMGPDLSRKHRSAIVVTPTSSKSTRESRREAESRKLQRRAAKKEARSLKIQELSSQREEMSDHDTMGSDDDSVGSFSCFSGSFDREEERDIVLMPVVLPHNASLAEGVHPSTLMHHHILSPMKELVNEDDG